MVMMARASDGWRGLEADFTGGAVELLFIGHEERVCLQGASGAPAIVG